MTDATHDSLVATEGVDEGSALSTAEDDRTAGQYPRGTPPIGRPAGEADPAGPLEVDTAAARAARGTGDGQELAQGEG